jgi:hypothetical protein
MKHLAIIQPNELQEIDIPLPRSDWELLKRVAEARSGRMGGKPSVPKVIESLIDEARADLESELPPMPPGGRPANREGKRQVAGWFSPELWEEVRMIAIRERSSVQELLREGLNDVLVKRGKPPIA